MALEQAAEIMKNLATSKAAPPGLSTNAEDQARLGFESGRSDFQINYPFIFETLDREGYEGWVGCEYKPAAKTSEGLGWFEPYRSRRA